MTIGLMYSGFLRSFYKKHPEYKNLSYKEQYENILIETSEPIGSYTRMFNKQDVEAVCIITNADFLQKKWREEYNMSSVSKNQLVLEQVSEYEPDVLWIDSIDYFEKNWVDQVRHYVPGIRLIIGGHCAPYNQRMLSNFRNLNFLFTCTPGMKEEFEKQGLKVHLVYHAFDPDVLKKISDNNLFPENNFIFSGSLYKGGGFHDKRIELLESILRNGIDLKIYGNLEKKCKTRAKQLIYYIFRLMYFLKIDKLLSRFQVYLNQKKYGKNLVPTNSKKLTKAVRPPVFGMDMFRLMKKSKIILNIHGDVAGDYAGNVRLFEVTGIGSCLLTDNKKNLSELFEIDKEIVVYNGINDCLEKIRWLSENEEERNTIASAGQKKTLTMHTVEERCKSMINIILEELKVQEKSGAKGQLK
jgi:spore maturation protein CgeB